MSNAMASNGYSNMGAAPSNSMSFVFVDQKTNNHQMLVPGMPIVLLADNGGWKADPSPQANPIWSKTGIVGTVRHVNPQMNGEIQVDIEWAPAGGVGMRNLYVINNGSVQLEFYPFAPTYTAPVKLTLDNKALEKLVLDESVKKEILAVLKQHENRGKLFDDWGLGDTIEYGRGMSMMFWGGPGTGKTWGAHCIAKALGTTLLTISAAEIQSSEPGASERNLQQAFKTATEENKVLFLDECDSLITTRADLGMVLAAQVNCLLTEIEKFEGVCILATNRIETMDEALERRLALIVEFPFPKYAQRVDIWKKLLPPKMPLADGVSAEVLAQPKFSGGQIKNIILQAARLAAAEDSKDVSQADFDKAIERLKKSKGIMGQRARSRTGRPIQDMDVGISSNMQVEREVDLDTFLDGDEETAAEAQ